MDGSPLVFTDRDRPFADDPARSFTLPARFYHDPEIFAREQPAIFFKSWWLAGHRSQLAKPGSYLTTQIHDQSLVLVHGRDGEIRAFHNVCQHRGHQLLEGCGQTQLITCPYHAWCYGLDGQLRQARNTQDMPEFDLADFALAQVRLDQMAGFLFVNLGSEAAPLADQFGTLQDEILGYVPRIEELTFARRYTYKAASNWKVMADNFLECYHCHVAHRDFVDLVDMPSYRSRTHAHYSSHIASSARTTESSAYRFEKGDVDLGFAGWYLWPNLAISAMPGEPNLFTLQIVPDGPDSTIEYLDWYLLDPEPSPQMLDAMVYIDEILQPEDIALCESVQRGLHSLGYNQGRFVVDQAESELSEHAVHHFQQMVLEALSRPS